jgi:hypothetical protein
MNEKGRRLKVPPSCIQAEQPPDRQTVSQHLLFISLYGLLARKYENIL